MSDENLAASGAGGASPRARHEFWVSDSAEDAVRKTKIVLKRLGELTEIVPGERVSGAVRFGINEATLRITWRAEAETAGKLPGASPAVAGDAAARATLDALMGTALILEADCPAARDAGTRTTAAKSAIERFQEAYLHFDDPDFKPDRLGLPPLALAGIVVFVVLVGYVLLHTRLAHYLLPQKPLTVHASPGPEASPDASPSPDSGDTGSSQ